MWSSYNTLGADLQVRQTLLLSSVYVMAERRCEEGRGEGKELPRAGKQVVFLICTVASILETKAENRASVNLPSPVPFCLCLL